MKSTRRRKFMKKNELSFAKAELTRLAFRETVSMFDVLMNTEIKTGEKQQVYLRDKASNVSKNMFNAIKEEYKHYCDYAFEDEELYRKQLKRRHKLFLWLKKYLLEKENEERYLLRDLKANRLDLTILQKYFKLRFSDEKELALFDDFFNKYLELKIVEDSSVDVNSETVKTTDKVAKEEKPAEVSEPVKIETVNKEQAEPKKKAVKEEKNVDVKPDVASPTEPIKENNVAHENTAKEESPAVVAEPVKAETVTEEKPKPKKKTSVKNKNVDVKSDVDVPVELTNEKVVDVKADKKPIEQEKPVVIDKTKEIVNAIKPARNGVNKSKKQQESNDVPAGQLSLLGGIHSTFLDN